MRCDFFVVRMMGNVLDSGSIVANKLSRDHISQGLTFVNLAADWRAVMRTFVLFALAL